MLYEVITRSASEKQASSNPERFFAVIGVNLGTMEQFIEFVGNHPLMSGAFVAVLGLLIWSELMLV